MALDSIALRSILEEAGRQRLTLFIGPDLAETVTGLPSPSQLVAELGQRLAISGQSGDLFALAQHAGRMRTRDIVQHLRDRLESTGKSPQPFDLLLAQLPVEKFITTRYDDLLVKAFEQVKRPIQPVTTDLDAGLIRGDQPVLVRLYGDLRQPQSLTLSEDDLFDLNQSKRGILRMVEQIYSANTLLFLGCDLDSPDFLALWRGALRDLGRLAPIAYASSSSPIPVDHRTMWRERNIEILNAPPLEVVQALAENLPKIGQTVTPIVIPPLPPPAKFKTTYKNFDLEIASTETGLRLRVLASPAGEAESQTDIQIPLPPTLNGVASMQGLDQEIGRRLLSGSVQGRWEASLALAQQAEIGLRLRLFIRDAGAGAVPWEAARLPDGWPALNPQTPMVRYVPTHRAPDVLQVEGPLRLLVVVGPAEELGLQPLHTATERLLLEEALESSLKMGKVQLHWLTDGVSWRKLQDTLRQVQPHLLHFVGHGDYDEEKQEGLLVLARPGQHGMDAHLINTDALGVLFGTSTVQLAIFNACQTGKAAGGVAQAAVRNVLPAAIGMQADVPAAVAAAFAGAFYRALADRWPVDAAVAAARGLLFGELEADSPWWAVPVLYMRSEDGVLFK